MGFKRGTGASSPATKKKNSKAKVGSKLRSRLPVFDSASGKLSCLTLLCDFSVDQPRETQKAHFSHVHLL